MNINNEQFNRLLEEMIKLLDKEAAHIEISLGMLDELRAMVIKRDEKSLQLLLEKVRIASEKHISTENARNNLRKQLAAQCGWPIESTTLTNLARILDANTSRRLLQKKDQLSGLLLKLKTEHMSTSMLLAECSRVNSVLLNALLNGRQDQITYNRGGSKNRTSKQNIVNLQL